MEVWFLVLIFNGYKEGGLSTVPHAFKTEQECIYTGEKFKDNRELRFKCIPALKESNNG